MLRLKCPVQNYAWGRKPDAEGKRGSEVIPNVSLYHLSNALSLSVMFPHINSEWGEAGLAIVYIGMSISQNTSVGNEELFTIYVPNMQCNVYCRRLLRNRQRCPSVLPSFSLVPLSNPSRMYDVSLYVLIAVHGESGVCCCNQPVALRTRMARVFAGCCPRSRGWCGY